MDGESRRRIRDALAREFNGICAYCERQCQPQTSIGDPLDREEIEHFRPRSRFPGTWLDWLNLVYACRRCNQAKGDSWPGFDDQLIDRILAAEDARYGPVSEYVSPNASADQKPASQFFGFDFDTGEIMPDEQLMPPEWSVARRTIRDIDLNDSGLGENSPNHLWRLRRNQLDLLRQTINAEGNDDFVVLVMREFTLPDSPFSGFISGYLATL